MSRSRLDASLQTLSAPTQGLPDAPVGAITFGAEIEPVVAAAAERLGDSEVTGFLRASYRPGETLGSAFARLFARLFAEWGVILLDSSDPALSELSQPVYHAAIERAPELNERLLARGRELEAAGYHQQVKVTPASIRCLLCATDRASPCMRRPERGDCRNFALRRRLFRKHSCCTALTPNRRISVPTFSSGRSRRLPAAYAGLHRRVSRGGLFRASRGRL